MAEQAEGRLTDIESKMENMTEQMKQLMELIKGKATQVPIKEPQDPTYPHGFT